MLAILSQPKCVNTRKIVFQIDTDISLSLRLAD